MTGTGKNVKQQHLINQGQIFIYDKRFLAGDEPSSTSDEESKPIPALHDTPSELENETSLPAWQQLFKSRRAWTLEAVDIVRTLSERSSQLSESCENIDRSTNVALDNLKNHVSNLESLFEKTQAWAQDTLREHADMLKEWRSMTETLKELPVREEIGRLMNASQSDDDHGENAGTMYSLLDTQALGTAHDLLDSCSNDFRSHFDNLTDSVEQLRSDSSSAAALLQIEWPNLETESLLQEAETLAKKVDGDYNDVLRAAPDTKMISKISRIAAGHTNSLLPELQVVVQDSIQVYGSAREHKQKLSKICFQVLRSISQVQSNLAGLQGQISTLGLSEEGQRSLETLDRCFRLPSAYGSILIEAIKRSEWNEQTVSDLKSFKDELSQHKDDELRRRKKWVSSMSTFLSEDTVSGSLKADDLPEFTFSTPSNPWPFVNREEIFSYIDDLRALDIHDSVEQITQQLRDLDSPAKTRRIRPQAFKNGSIHDAIQNSFVRHVKGNSTELRALQDDKSRLEDKLRASESRIRKLEDIIHRQSQVQASSNLSRVQSDVFSPIAAADFERPPTSPGPDHSARAQNFDAATMSRRSSVSHQASMHARRLSNQTADEKGLIQKITQLESQISTLRDEVQSSHVIAETRLKSLQEAEAVKGDLLANFDAQRAEFDDERQRLEDDNHEMKIKFEELEEELDRLAGSRDHARMKSEEMLSHLRSELERMRRTSNDELDRLRKAKESLDAELSGQREKHSIVESQVQQLRTERTNSKLQNAELAKTLRNVESQKADLVSTLQSVHEQLSPAGSAPDDLTRLASTLEVLAEGATIHARGLDDALQLAIAQGKANEEKIEQLEAELKNNQLTKTNTAARIAEKDEQLRTAQHSLETLRFELADERKQIEQLSDQFADGATGSDSLRARLTEEEKKVIELSSQKDKNKVQIETLQQNLSTQREQLTSLKTVADVAHRRLGLRGEKVRELSERLFQHNDRMVRLAENFGYFVSREGDGLSMQRSSKVNASQILGDALVGIPMKRQISGSIPAQHYTDPTDAQTLYWTHETDSDIENAKYQAFLKTLARVDIDSTTELLTKRYKDVEQFAKKYQKDSKVQRERTHRLQSEAHEKIAYRSFKEGDLALFLPTRNQATKPWAAFNVGAPHYFLREMDGHRLQSREWLLARISKIEERVVDLSRSMGNASTKGNAEASDGGSLQSIDDNPFELSDGLRWYLVEASEEKPGAPTTPGLGKSTVAASVVEVKAQMGRKSSGVGGKDSDKGTQSAVNAAKTLHKSLDSRRSSEASRKSAGPPLLRANASGSSAVAALIGAGTDGEAEGTMSPVNAPPTTATGTGSSVRPSEADTRQGRAREDDKIFDVVRQDLMLGP